MTDRITDPEVLADMRRRNDSERDSERTRPAGWTKPVIAAHWPCAGCGEMVGMTREALDLHATMSRGLRSRGEAPLEKRAQCGACRNGAPKRWPLKLVTGGSDGPE